MGKKDLVLLSGSQLELVSSSKSKLSSMSQGQKSVQPIHSIHQLNRKNSLDSDLRGLSLEKSDLGSPKKAASSRWSNRSSQVTHLSSQTQFKKYLKGQTSSKGVFGSLPLEITYLILYHLDVPSLSRVSQSSRFLNKLCQNDSLYKRLSFSKFNIHSSRCSLLSSPSQDTQLWKSCYMRLDSGLTTWSGLALDPITNNAQPYDMELIIKSMKHKLRYGLLPTTKRSGLSSAELDRSFFQISEFKGHCRWRDLEDALTLVEGSITDALVPGPPSRFEKDLFLGNRLPRLIEFSEVDIIRGQDLAVPNRYQGLKMGNLILGTYDPGHPSLIGCFAATIEESLPMDLRESFREGLKERGDYRGLLTHYRTTLGIHETAFYIRLQIRSLQDSILQADITVYPSVHIQTSLKTAENEPGDNELEWEAARLRLTAALPVSTTPSCNSVAQSLKIIEMERVFEGFSKRYHVWLETHFPKAQELKLFVAGSSLFGLFLGPRPGCFCVSLESFPS